MVTWPLTVNNQNGIQYTVQTVKMYTSNQLNHHFNWREIKIIARIDWGILLGTLRTSSAKPREITFIKATQIRGLLRSSGREGWSLLLEANFLKLAQGTIRLKSLRSECSHDNQAGGWFA